MPSHHKRKSRSASRSRHLESVNPSSDESGDKSDASTLESFLKSIQGLHNKVPLCSFCMSLVESLEPNEKEKIQLLERRLHLIMAPFCSWVLRISNEVACEEQAQSPPITATKPPNKAVNPPNKAIKPPNKAIKPSSTRSLIVKPRNMTWSVVKNWCLFSVLCLCHWRSLLPT